MIKQIANPALRFLAAPTRHRALNIFERHQSTAPRPEPSIPEKTTPVQPLQPSPPPVKTHPSSEAHPALRSGSSQRNNDNAIFLIFGGLLIGAIPLSYWYWGYRERKMREKKEEMLRGIQERYAARHGSG